MTDTLNFSNFINLGQADLREVIRMAYALSSPQGLGMLHLTASSLGEEEISTIIERESGSRMNPPIVAGMDYVNGRAVKLIIHRDPETGDLLIKPRWVDHSEEELQTLLLALHIPLREISRARAAQDEINAAYARARKEADQ